MHGLVGESGAGKSTIAKAILGIVPSQVKITGGRIVFEGRDLLALSASELRAALGRDITLVPQDPSTALNPSRRIDVQMTDGLRLKRGLSMKEARLRACGLLAEVQIRDPERVLSSYPHQLSGGMRQRCSLRQPLRSSQNSSLPTSRRPRSMSPFRSKFFGSFARCRNGTAPACCSFRTISASSRKSAIG